MDCVIAPAHRRPVRRLAFDIALTLALGAATQAQSASAQVVEARASAQEPPQPPVSAPEPLAGSRLGASAELLLGLCVPPEGGRLGLTLAGELRYGIALGPLVLAPGVRVASLFVAGAIGLAGLAGLRLTLPLPQIAPYVALGVGPGYRSGPAQLALAYQGSAGLTVPFSERITVGIEASYLQLVDVHFRRLSFGPTVSLGF